MSARPGWGDFCQPPALRHVRWPERTPDEWGASLQRTIRALAPEERDRLLAMYALGDPDSFEYHLRQISYDRAEDDHTDWTAA